MAVSEDSSEVTVIGAGIVGVCASLSLLESGFSVRLIDRNEPGEGASHGNAGVISPWSCVPQALPGVWRAVPRWLLDPEGPVRVRLRDLPGFLPWALRFLNNTSADKVARTADAMDALVRGNVAGYRRFLAGTGREDLLRDSWYVNVFRGDHKADLAGPAWQLRLERGAPVELVDGDRLREIEPDLSPAYHSAILIKDQARAVAPGRLCKVLAEKAREAGARFQRAEVRALRPRAAAGLDIETDGGRLRAQKVVLCAGAWSARLLAPLGLSLPLAAERGYHLEFSEPGVTVRNSIMDVAGKFVVSSMEGGLRAAGTAEFASLDAPPNDRRARIFERLAKRLLPGLDTGRSRAWMGPRPSFPDSLPAIGPLAGIDGLFAAFGHSHYGLGMAPATGRMVADLVAGRTPNLDVAPYSPDRFR